MPRPVKIRERSDGREISSEMLVLVVIDELYELTSLLASAMAKTTYLRLRGGECGWASDKCRCGFFTPRRMLSIMCDLYCRRATRTSATCDSYISCSHPKYLSKWGLDRAMRGRGHRL